MAIVKWILDPAHSEILFKVKHLMISTVTGSFRKFDLTLSTEGEDFMTAFDLQFSAEADSVTTNNDQRDHHLKSGDFFDVKKYPLLSFAGERVFMENNQMLVEGNLTIKGVTKQIRANLALSGVALDPYGQTKAGFAVDGKINRRDFGLVWGAVTEAGNVVVSDDVKFEADIQLIKLQE